jgi:hypothetical protein
LSLPLVVPVTACTGGMNSWCAKPSMSKNPGNFFTAPCKYLLRNNLILLKATGRMLIKIIIIIMAMMMMMMAVKELSHSQHNIFLRGTSSKALRNVRI